MKVFKILYFVLSGVLFIVALFLIISILPIPGGYKVMAVLSGSMEPAIKTGSVVVVKPSAQYKIGNIITFQGKGNIIPITHRIIEMRVDKGSPLYITKGDANNAQDLREIREPEIIGKVLFSTPYIGYGINAAKKPFGFVALILIPAVIITTDQIKNIWQEIKKRKEK